MKVLVACEFSGRVRDAFTKRGHDATSCDLEPSETEGKHYQGDVRDLLLKHWDLMIAHPDCTYLSKASGAHWKKASWKVGQIKAYEFVVKLWNAPINHIAIENPIGWLNTHWQKPTQIIQPFQFGDAWTKQTCLWLKNLPTLQPTNPVEPQGNWVKPGNKRPWRKFDEQPEGAGGSKRERSRTFYSIARAMAEQWG